MDLLLRKKVALVCASSAGIGKAIAKGLAEEGTHVSIFSRTDNSIKRAAEDIAKTAQGKVIYNVCDISNFEDVKRIIEDTNKKLGLVDILINNQGGPAAGSIEQLTDKEIDSAIITNLRSVIHITKLCLPAMKQRSFGRIINILSISAKEALPGMLLSNIVRPALLGFSKTIAREYAPFGITVNSLLPSAVLTDRATSLMQKQATEQGVDFDAVLRNAIKSLPIGRMASPEEFAQLAVFLSSPKASYITGTAIAVDGGASHSIF